MGDLRWWKQSSLAVAKCRRQISDGFYSHYLSSQKSWRRLVVVAKSNGDALNGDQKNAVAKLSPLLFCDSKVAFGDGFLLWLTEFFFVVIGAQIVLDSSRYRRKSRVCIYLGIMTVLWFSKNNRGKTFSTQKHTVHEQWTNQ